MTKKSDITLNTILDQFRDDARNNRDLGDRFERMMVQYLGIKGLPALNEFVGTKK